MSFTELVLSPFIFIIKQLFLFSYSLTNNYGLSIILLSFSISLLLLPIFILIEKAKKRDDAVKRKMKPQLDEIKRCYKQQERYYYIRTLNKQYNYSPIRSLIPTLSLLLQIPFFIAAYQFLENFEPLKGVSFVFINDLSSPDALFGAINILPIAMTFVNLLTAYFYTRNGDTSERKQMLVVAGIFLVLLFNLPAGLVLYWTMNNVFSFFRLFITNGEVFKKVEVKLINQNFTFSNLKSNIKLILPKLWATFIVISVLAILSQLNWAFHNNLDDLFLRLILAPAASFLTIIIISILVLIHKVDPLTKKTALKEYFIELWPTFKPTLYVVLTVAFLSQINWAIKFNFDTIILRLILGAIGAAIITLIIALTVLFYQGHIEISRWLTTLLSSNIVKTFKNDPKIFFKELKAIKIKPWVFFSLVFLSLYFYLSSKFYYGGANYYLSIFGVLIIIPTQIIGITYFLRARKTTKLWLFYASLSLLFLVLIFQSLYCWVIIVDNNAIIKFINLSFLITETNLNNFILFGLVFTLITIPYVAAQSGIKFTPTLKPNWIIYSLAILYLTGFVFLWNPLAIYSSYPANFEFPAIDILKNNLGLFVIALSSLLFLYLILPRLFKYFLLNLILIITVSSFINNTVMPINLGSLQENKFLNQDNLAQPLSHFWLEGLGLLCIIFGVRWMLKKNYLKQIYTTLLFLNIILISQGLFEAIRTGEFFRKPEISNNISSSISFSKDKENIVFLISDMFHGWYMNRILKEEPELKKEFDGFTWYPNTLAISSITSSSIPAILGGYDFTIDKLNKDENRNCEEKITEITNEFFNKVKSKGYRYTSTQMIYSLIDINSFDTYLPPWHDDWNKWNNKLNIGISKEIGYTLLWENAAFYSAPLFLKAKIYNQGRWFQGDIQTNENTSKTKPYNFLRLLPFISNSTSDKPNFIYIHSMASHHPWDIMDSDGKMHPDVTPYENNKWVIETLANWINWMKENGVYNNTKIIILSDHGPHWWHFKGEIDMDIPLIPNPSLKIENNVPLGLFPLLMVKDFNKTGEIKSDWRFMSNADARAIAFDENDPTKGIAPKTRTLPTSMVNWERKISEHTKLKIIYQFEAKDNAFDLNNWKRIK